LGNSRITGRHEGVEGEVADVAWQDTAFDAHAQLGQEPELHTLARRGLARQHCRALDAVQVAVAQGDLAANTPAEVRAERQVRFEAFLHFG
jgi:hypothetical protein